MRHSELGGLVMKRKFVIGGGILAAIIAVVVVVLVFVVSNLDSLIKAAVEKFGSEVTQAKVTLKNVEISPTSGKGALTQLIIGNPAGFKTESAFELGQVSVALDIGTVTNDTVVINEIIIAAPQITYELGSKGSNLDAIQRNVESYLGPQSKGEALKPGEAAKKDGKKLIINLIRITGGKVNVSATFLQGRKMTAPLPDIRLTDIGKKEKGASPGEVVKKVMAAVTQASQKAVTSLNLGDMMKSAGSKVKAIQESLGQGSGGAADTITKGAEGAGKALKGLFGR